MCVTNIAHRRNVTPSAPNGGRPMISKTPSLISQRLMGNFMPLMLNNNNNSNNSAQINSGNSAVAPAPTVSTQNHVDYSGESSMASSSSGYFPQEQQQFLNQQQQQQTFAINNGLNGEKRRPKRRRKPQKPGKTAKMNDRHFVVHDYHDHALDPDENDVDHAAAAATAAPSRRRGGVSVSFPMKLHSVLEQVEADGLGHVISWQPHGRCFVIHKPKQFTEHVMPHYFRQSKLTSFQRQLNLYGFCRLTRGPDSGGYYHELFLRGKAFLTKKMQRTKIKGTKFKAASSPEQEPDFYAMSPVCGTTLVSSDDSSTDDLNQLPPVATRRVPAGMTFLQQDTADALSFEPLPMQIPRNQAAPPMSPYPLLAASFPGVNGMGNAMNNNNNTNAVGMMGMMGRGADEILDEAVDELFSNEIGMGDAALSLQETWDGSEFGDEGVQTDLQLGYMLEKLLDA